MPEDICLVEKECLRLVSIIRGTFFRSFKERHLDIRDLEQETYIIAATSIDFNLAYTRAYYVALKMLRSRFTRDDLCCSLIDHRCHEKVSKQNESSLQGFRLDLLQAIIKMSDEELKTVKALHDQTSYVDFGRQINRSDTVARRKTKRVQKTLADRLRFWRDFK